MTAFQAAAPCGNCAKEVWAPGDFDVEVGRSPQGDRIRRSFCSLQCVFDYARKRNQQDIEFKERLARAVSTILGMHPADVEKDMRKCQLQVRPAQIKFWLLRKLGGQRG
jgi:hypothetical protein